MFLKALGTFFWDRQVAANARDPSSVDLVQLPLGTRDIIWELDLPQPHKPRAVEKDKSQPQYNNLGQLKPLIRRFITRQE
jgi:hypothetical protein